MENEEGVSEVTTPEAEVQTVPYYRFSQEVAKRKTLEEQLAALNSQKEKQDLIPQENQFDSIADNLSVLRNLDDSEVTELRVRAKELNIDPAIFAKSPTWKSHIDTMRANRQSDQKTPAPSNRTAVYEGKTFANIVSGEDSPEVKQAAFIAQRDSLLNRGRNQMI